MGAKKKPSAVRHLAEERFSFARGSVDRSDPDRPIIRGALLCGHESANTFIGEGRDRVSVNGRRYLRTAFDGDRVKLYDGRPVFLNHPDKPTDKRKYQDKIATVQNARQREDGMPIGDLLVNPRHPHAEQFLWDAENDPKSCGMSHRAWCEWKTNSQNVAEAHQITEILSVDLVVDSATTRGVFEHKEPTVSKVKIAAVAEWVVKHPKSTSAECIRMKRLAEENEDVEMDMPADDAEPASAIDDAFRTLLHAHMDEMIDGSQTIEEFVKKVKALKKAHSGKKDDGGEEEEVEVEVESDDAEEEGKNIGYAKAISICAESKHTATPAEYKLLSRCRSVQEAKDYLAEQSGKASKAVEQKPRSAGRTVAAPPVKSQPVQESRAIPAWDAIPSLS